MEESGNSDLKFHYDREARLKKLHRPSTEKGKRHFSRKKRRGLLIVIVDLLLIALVLYYLNKPTNVFLEKREGSLVYELNVADIRGAKTLIGFTVKSLEETATRKLISGPVTVKIIPQTGESRTFQKYIEPDTVLRPGEISSTVFLIGEGELPDWGLLELYYDNIDEPLFSKRVRF
jgi:hypothetical protein